MVEKIEKEEEKKKEEPEAPAPDTDKGSEQETTPLIEQANSAAKRMEEANKRTEELLKRQEELESRRTLGGKSEAGQGSEKKEITAEEYTRSIESGVVPEKK